MLFYMETNSHCQWLEKFGVASRPASASFRQWISALYPKWAHADEFCRCIPVAQTQLIKDDCYYLGYVWPEDWLMERSEQWRETNCLPIGSLSSGSWIAIDCSATDSLILGCFPLELFFEKPNRKLKRGHFESFEISYSDWLQNRHDDPEDRTYA